MKLIVMKKTIFALILPLVAVLACAQVFQAGNLYYSIAGGEATVLRVPTHDKKPYSGTVIIPNWVYYDGANYPVTAIADSAFWQSKVTELQVPNSVTRIGVSAFAHAQDLASITLPLGLKTLSTAMLAGTAIVNVAVPEGVDSIGGDAFESCSQLHTALLPSTLAYVGAHSFGNCHNLYELYCAALMPPATPDSTALIAPKGVDVVVPDYDAVDAYQDNAVWGNDSTFRVFPNEDISLTMSGKLEHHNDHYMRLRLGGNLAYKIYADDELVALTAAESYYVPILDHRVTYSIVPTTMMSDADVVQLDIAPATVENIEKMQETVPEIYVQDGLLYITGDNYGKWVRVYDMYGMLYYSRSATSGEIIDLPRNRVYVVMVGNYVKKVCL